MEDQFSKIKYEKFKGMRIWTIQATGNGNAVTDLGLFEPAEKGEPANIYMLPKARRVIDGWSGIEGVMAHELVHFEQDVRIKDKEIGEPGTDAETRELGKRMGWEYHAKHKSLLKDKDGGLWKILENRDDWEWKAGTPPKNGEKKVSETEMREIAAVRPPTVYFDTPSEMHAEATALFRMERAKLAKESPQIYKAVREYDQSNITKALKSHASGEPKFIRDIDGNVVPNTVATRARIQAVEKTWGVD